VQAASRRNAAGPDNFEPDRDGGMAGRPENENTRGRAQIGGTPEVRLSPIVDSGRPSREESTENGGRRGATATLRSGI